MAYSNDMFGLQQLMADEQAAQQQSNINNAVNLASTKGAGMMYRAGGIGDQRGQAYASLGRMLTGQEEPVDPRMARMQKLEEIRRKVPMPETAEDFKNLARLLNGAELYEEAGKAMTMANEIKSQLPTKSTAYKEYSEMTTNPTPEGFKEWYKETTGGDFNSHYSTPRIWKALLLFEL